MRYITRSDGKGCSNKAYSGLKIDGKCYLHIRYSEPIRNLEPMRLFEVEA